MRPGEFDRLGKRVLIVVEEERYFEVFRVKSDLNDDVCELTRTMSTLSSSGQSDPSQPTESSEVNVLMEILPSVSGDAPQLEPGAQADHHPLQVANPPNPAAYPPLPGLRPQPPLGGLLPAAPPLGPPGAPLAQHVGGGVLHGAGPPGPPGPPIHQPVGGLGQGAFGPALRAILFPARDDLQHRQNDRHGVHLRACQAALQLVVHLTYRETRHLLLGGPPGPAPQVPYPGIPYFSIYLNKCLLPSLIEPLKYKSYFGVDLQDFYLFRDQFVVPALIVNNKKIHLGTADSVTALFFLKLRQDTPYEILSLMFGFSSAQTAWNWFDFVLDFIYSNAGVLQRSRNLSNPGNMAEIMEEFHGATMRNTRFTAAFLPTMQRFEQQNPHLGPQKLVCISWDSRCVLCPHTLSFDHQKRIFSSKVQNNAITKIVATGLDGIQRFCYMSGASISPANTDEGVCSFLIDLETNQGVIYSALLSFWSIHYLNE